MKLTSLFIKKPVTALVLNSMIAVIGFLCFHNLSVREYPNISFPIITINSTYPNASPDLVETAVTNVLEDRLAGVEGLEDITSESASGYSYISLSFRPGISMDKALAEVQDAVGYARALLPTEVRAPLVERQKKSSAGLPFIGIALESTTTDFGALTHFANLNIKNVLRSVPGVSSVSIWGVPYTYQIMLEPQKLFTFGVNVDEVVDALNASHITMPAGNYQNKIPSTLNSELKNTHDYENLLIKIDPKNPISLKSVATVKLTTDDSQSRVRVNGHAGLVIAIDRANDANPLEVSSNIQAAVHHLQQSMPDNMKLKIIIDQSDFIRASLKNIHASILESIILVLIIVFLFLRSLSATLIPLITIPISLLGSLIFLKLFGFSLNLMTLLAMVLAIGLVVDDAIIVLENIWRHIEQGLSPIAAATRGAREIGFAIVAMTCTLAAVYLPIAFIQGMLGQLFIEFAVALAGSVFISGLVALSLSPIMCAQLLNKNNQAWWPQIDHALDWLSNGYARALRFVLHRPKLLAAFALMSIALSIFLYQHIEQETAPKEDRGMIGVFLPQANSDNIESIDQKISQIEQITQALPESANQLAFISTEGSGIVIPLKPHTQRRRSADSIVEDLTPKFLHFPSVDPMIWSWNTGLPGLDDAGTGSELALVISTPDQYRDLFNQVEKLKAALDKTQQFEFIYYDLRLDTLGYTIELDHNQLARLGLNARQVAKTIEVFFSGDNSQTFEKDGVVYNLSIKGARSPWTLNELYLTTPKGKRVSLGALTRMHPKAQPASLTHVQQMRSTTIHLSLKKGQSASKQIDSVWKLAKANLPQQYTLSWTGSAKALHESSHTMTYLLLLSLLFIYAILATQFENFIDPFIILFSVPLACSGALLCVYIFGQTLNIYTQVGLITLIGLISKHGILIVEFANQLHKSGNTWLEAVQQAAKLRLRPILMTTGAMIFGAIPLVLSHDAGAESRHAIGTVLIGGLTIGTLFTLFILPSIYLIVKSKGRLKQQ